MYIVAGNLEKYELNAIWCTYTTTIFSLSRVSFYNLFFYWFLISWVYFVIIYITLIVCLLIMFLDDIKVWFRGLVVFRCSWLLYMPGSVIVGFLIEYSLLVMYPSPNCWSFGYLNPITEESRNLVPRSTRCHGSPITIQQTIMCLWTAHFFFRI